MATQVQIGFEEAVGWVVTAGNAGPAGAVPLPLDGIVVTVDATDAGRLVELTVSADRQDVPVSTRALDVCRELVGDVIADAIAERPSTPVTLTVAEPSGPRWEQVAATARAWFLWSHDTTAPRLAALRLVASSWPLAPLGTAEMATERAWEALPGVVALGRFAGRQPVVVDRLSGPRRAELAVAVRTLAEVLAADAWDGTGSGPIGDLAALLTGVTDADLEDLMDAPPDESVTEQWTPAYRRGADEPQTIAVRWQAGSRDLRSRLGDFAGEAFAGASARGDLPGILDVLMPLRLGLTKPDAPKLVARVYSWSGELLGERRLRFSALPNQLPRASAEVPVRLPELAADRARVVANGVHVDIALDGLPPLGMAGLRREARARARRAAVGAILARHAGNRHEEADGWAWSARLYALAGNDADAEAAMWEAGVASQRLRDRHVLSADGPDWVEALLANWREAARAALGEAASTPLQERSGLLRPLVTDLSAGASGLPELAAACEDLADALLRTAEAGGAVSRTPGAAGSDGAAAGDTDPADTRIAAAALLREALRVRYLLGAAPTDAWPTAARLVRKLNEISEDEHRGEDR